LWVDRNGKEQTITAPARAYSGFKISPDGSRVALAVETSGNDDIWIWDLIRETLTRLTFDEAEDSNPLWTRDGKRVAFFSNRKDTSGVYWKAADGTGVEELIGSSANRLLVPWSWSPDGKVLAMTELKFSPAFSIDIGVLSIEDKRKRIALLEEKYIESDPQISPDGRWIAYTSNESGTDEIYVRPFPEVNKGRWQVSTGGGEMSLWSPDGRELFYRSGDAVMAVKAERDPTFKPGRPEVLFRGTYIPPGTEGIPWDISPDGKRFLMMKESGAASGTSTAGETMGAGPRKINIVLNWLEELKQRVPVK
jgi:eukaryotic-like serine/threonine-protein kinase